MARQIGGLPGAALVAAAGALAALVAGCGGSEGVTPGATTAAYAESPLCAEAKRELARAGGRAGDVDVRVICLPVERDGDHLSLATIGANARRATEDSTTVGYIAEPDPKATRFSRPILEEAGIAQISTSSGAIGMKQLLSAVGEAGSASNLRESVDESLGNG